MTISELLKDIRPDINFNQSHDFINDGFLDSYDLMQLVGQLELQYQIEIDFLNADESDFRNFDTIKELIRKSGGKIDD